MRREPIGEHKLVDELMRFCYPHYESLSPDLKQNEQDKVISKVKVSLFFMSTKSWN